MPNFEQTNVNYAAEYSEALDEQYPYLSYYADLWNQGEGERYRPLRGKSVEIPVLSVSGARAVDRDRIDGVFTRKWNNDWYPASLDMDREWDTLIDPVDEQESIVGTMANVSRTFIRTQKVPEQDAYMSAKLAGFARDFGGVDGTTITANNILSLWDNAIEYMQDQRVPLESVRCKMIPGVYKLLKNAVGVTRFISVERAGDVNRNIGSVDNISVQAVPRDMMKTAYDFTEGWAVAPGAEQIGMMFYTPEAIGAPIQYDTAMISPATAQSKGKKLYYERYYYGAFCLKQRQSGLLCFMSGTPTLPVLTVVSAAGTNAAGDTVITVSGDQIFASGRLPEGLDLYYTAGASAAVALTYGAALPAGSTWTKATGNPIAMSSQTAGKYITVALVNRQTEKVVAGGSTTLVVKA